MGRCSLGIIFIIDVRCLATATERLGMCRARYMGTTGGYNAWNMDMRRGGGSA